ncbi:calcium/calmodulin-dependent 3',5'-cyclic nucleotide phosphodiesterase 1A-like isoform X2 [Actinia tenebrosa]|uniref:Phosphodiesterase n=1 Tax=Actinia tenebrosa TaxID=6105 RepID=A0A6P8IDL2_ACTTE|nr:calcium/calmodulin-dependent 3',5'-cyclic nucleotide phosphodiesterase 1A-like isoform X2 [Actinia tenebrosa]
MGLRCSKPMKEKQDSLENDQKTNNKYVKNAREGENVQPLIHVTTASTSSDQNVNNENNASNTAAPTQSMIIRRRNTEYKPRPKSMDDYTDTATTLALSKLRHLIYQLNEGKINSVSDMKEELSQAVAIMDVASSNMRDYRGSMSAISDIDDELYTDVVSDEVREWIATTFARGPGTLRRKSIMPRHTFRGVVHAVKASLYVNKILKNASERNKLQVPEEVLIHFEKLNEWTFDVFSLSEATEGHSLRFMGHEVLSRMDLLRLFKVNVGSLDRFLLAVEEGYQKNGNPYHNECHATDVTHTVFYFLSVIGLAQCLSDLEIFALLLSAIIHDLEHTGTTNAFHINSRSEMALLYNDRSVLENHHLTAAFKLLQDNDRNILANLNDNQYSGLRSLVIDMVLATDMTSHFEQLRTTKVALVGGSPIENSELLQLILHVADISNPTKDWQIHQQWTQRIMEEFFTQGDMEIELGLDVSPLCDRSSTRIPESQVGFIDVIVSPAFEVCSEALEVFLQENSTQTNVDMSRVQPWSKPLANNRRKWKEQFQVINKDL